MINTTARGLSDRSHIGYVPLDHCDLQRQVSVNNLPKVVTRQRALTTGQPSHLCCRSRRNVTDLTNNLQYHFKTATFQHRAIRYRLVQIIRKYRSHVSSETTCKTNK